MYDIIFYSINQNTDLYSTPKQKLTEVPVTSRHAKKATT